MVLNNYKPPLENMMKYLAPSVLLTLFLQPALVAAPVYENNFSSAPTVTDPAPSGTNTSPWIGTSGQISMPGAGNYTFLEDFASVTHDAGNENLDISGGGNAWLLINTSTWSTGDYTVTFDGQVTSGDTMVWDVIGGNASGGLAVRLWMNQSSPYVRAASAGTAERLGETTLGGGTAGTATQSGVAAGSFTDTTFTSQSLFVSLTANHVGSTNDYILIGWNNTGGNGTATIDNIDVSVVPEPSSIALLGIAALAVYALRRRK
jgi:hypothetical protein